MAAEELGHVVLELVTKQDQLDAGLAEVRQKLDGLKPLTKQTADSFRAFGQQATALGRALMPVSAAVAAIGIGSAKLAIDFESSFAGVRKTVDASEEEFAQLAQGFRDLSKEIPVNVNELNRIGEAAGQLGIKKENILSFTDTIAKLGVATNLTSDEAATSLARLANITQMPQTEFDRLGSTIVALGNNFATTESEIVEFGLRIAGAGKLAGLSEAQILAIGTAMSSVGVEAEAGGTSVQKVLLGMVQAVAEGGDELEVFAETAGMTSDAFARTFRDDAGAAFTAFVTGLGQQGDQAFATLEALHLADQRLIRSFLSLAGAGDLVTRAMGLANTEWEKNSALSEEARKRFETTQKQLEQLWIRLKDVGITIGNVMLPAINGAIDGLGRLIPLIEDAASWFSNLPSGVRNTAIGFAAFVAAGAPLLTVIGSLASSLAAVMPAIAAIGGAIAALATGPILAIGAAIAGLTAVWMIWGDDITRIVSETIGTVKQWLVDIWQSDIVQAVVGMLDAMRDLYIAVFERIAEEAGVFIGAVRDWLVDKFEPVVQAVQPILAVLADVWGTVRETVVGIAQDLYEGVRGWLVDRFGDIVDGMKKKIDAVTNFFRDLHEKVVGHSYVPDMVDGIGQEFKRLDKEMIKPTTAATTAVATSFRELQANTRRAVVSFVDQLAEVRRETASLSAEQRRNIAAGVELGVSIDKIAKAMGVSKEAVARYKEQLAEAEKEIEKKRKATEKWHASITSVTQSMVRLSSYMVPFARAVDDAGVAIRNISAGLAENGTLILGNAQETEQARKAAEEWARANGAVLAPSLKDTSAAIEDATEKAQTFGDAMRDGLRGVGDVIASLPATMARAFEGGGGILGALKSIGVQIADAIAAPIIAGLTRVQRAAVGAGSTAAAALGGSAAGGMGATVGSLASGLGGAAIAATGWGTAMTAAGVAGTVALGAATLGIGAAAVGIYMLAKRWSGVSEEVKKARGDVKAYEDAVIQTLTATQLAEAGGERWKQVSIAVRDAYLATGRTAEEAERAVLRMWESSRQGPEAAQRAITEVNGVLSEHHALLEEAAAGAHTWDDLEKQAGEYGVDLAALGPAFASAKLTEKMGGLIQFIERAQKAGGDWGAIMMGTRDEIAEVIEESRRLGIALPANMKPFIDDLFESGNLLDSQGNKMEDISDLEYTEPLEVKVGNLIDAMGRLIDIMGRIPARVDTEVHTRYTEEGEPSRESERPRTTGPYPMAAGGLGRVYEPTLFLAGEAGPEDFAFSGAHRSFVDPDAKGSAGEGKDLAAWRQTFRDEFDALRRVLAITLRDAAAGAV